LFTRHVASALARPAAGCNHEPLGQAEADRFADALSAVPEAEQCGWVKDGFGVSWQIVSRQLIRLIGDADRARASRVFDAMMQMKRIDIAAIERAADSIAPSA
jgi:predicted 3-demethylubiquinone-9 3-methyltransferase (glyoxalase superfamily)